MAVLAKTYLRTDILSISDHISSALLSVFSEEVRADGMREEQRHTDRHEQGTKEENCVPRTKRPNSL